MKDSHPKDSSERLRQARIKAGFRSARAAAIRFGWTPSTYASHENGQTAVPQEAAAGYAKAFRTSFVWLLTGETAGEDTVRITGLVLKRGEVKVLLPEQAPWVWLPFGLAANYLVFRVDEDFPPRYGKGDVIICNDPRFFDETVQDELSLFDDAIVFQADGPALLRSVKPGQKKGSYVLQAKGLPTISDATPSAAFGVVAVVYQPAELIPGKSKLQRPLRKSSKR